MPLRGAFLVRRSVLNGHTDINKRSANVGFVPTVIVAEDPQLNAREGKEVAIRQIAFWRIILAGGTSHCLARTRRVALAHARYSQRTPHVVPYMFMLSTLQEFHRRRMRYYLRLVKERTDQALWQELSRTEPNLLHNTPTLGRCIRWDEIDGAEHPLFGATTAQDLPPAPQFHPPALLATAPPAI